MHCRDIVIIDFGSACIVNPKHDEISNKTLCMDTTYTSGITLSYTPPKVLNYDSSTEESRERTKIADPYKIDVFAFGCVLYELFSPDNG